jgi:hypothetical protein
MVQKLMLVRVTGLKGVVMALFIAGLAAYGSGSTMPAFALAAGCDGAPAGSKVVIVSPTSGASAACEAAFLAEAIVIQFGGTDQSLENAIELGRTSIGGAFASETQHTGTRTPSAVPTPPFPSAWTPGHQMVPVIAYHLTPSGQTDMLHGFSGAPLTHWIASEKASDSQRARPRSAPAVSSAPAVGSWIPMINDTITDTDPDGNSATVVNTYYKLYERNPSYDYYMIASTSRGFPAYQTCNLKVAGDGAVGWYTDARLPSMTVFSSPDPSLRVYDHGPLNVPSTTSASFSIGASLSNPSGVNATYSQSWSQPDVSTIDQTGLFGPQSADWTQNFAGWTFNPLTLQTSCPPLTSTGTFSSPWAAIYQIAEAKVPSLRSGTVFVYEYDETYGNTFRIDKKKVRSSQPDIGDAWYIVAPYLNFCRDLPHGEACGKPFDYALPADASLTLKIFFQNSSPMSPLPPNGVPTPSLFQPAWTISNVPSWLNVSRLTGSGSGTITLTQQPGTPVGSIATLNFDTDPPGGTPELEAGPEVLTIRAAASQ